MFCCLVGDQRPACRCNSLRGTINAIPLQIPWPDGVGGGKRTRLLDQACHLLRSTSGDKADLLPYRRQKIAFILFFDCFFSLSLARAYTHTHTHTHSVSFSLPFSPIIPLCFHYPFSSVSIIPLLFRHFRNLFLLFLISQCLFRTTILFTESLSFYSPRHRFRLFAASVFPSSPLRSSVSFPRSFALLRCLV